MALNFFNTILRIKKIIQVEHANAQLLYGLGKMQKTDFFKIFFYQ